MVNHGADINTRDAQGNGVLHYWAAGPGREIEWLNISTNVGDELYLVTEAFMIAHADFKMLNNSGQTPYEYAKEKIFGAGPWGFHQYESYENSWSYVEFEKCQKLWACWIYAGLFCFVNQSGLLQFLGKIIHSPDANPGYRRKVMKALTDRLADCERIKQHIAYQSQLNDLITCQEHMKKLQPSYLDAVVGLGALAGCAILGYQALAYACS